MSNAFTSAVIIPARNEERRLPMCLAALSPQIGDDVLVVVVANNCTDGTAEAARQAIGRSTEIVDCVLGPSQGVGEARQRGCLHALSLYPEVDALMTTDADCVVATDWIVNTLSHLHEVDAVCGRVEPMPDETAILAGMPVQEGTNEAIYRDLVLCFYDVLAPEMHNRYPHHGEASGASLACRVSAWKHVGGFGDLRTGEDRDLIRRMRENDLCIRHADDVRVQASCRLIGRAPGGMADTLRDRLQGVDYRVDEALPPVARLFEMARRGRLDSWPPDTPTTDRLRPADLPAQIARLTDFLAGAGATATGPLPTDQPPAISIVRDPSVVADRVRTANHPAGPRSDFATSFQPPVERNSSGPI